MRAIYIAAVIALCISPAAAERPFSLRCDVDGRVIGTEQQICADQAPRAGWHLVQMMPLTEDATGNLRFSVGVAGSSASLVCRFVLGHPHPTEDFCEFTGGLSARMIGSATLIRLDGPSSLSVFIGSASCQSTLAICANDADVPIGAFRVLVDEIDEP